VQGTPFDFRSPAVLRERIQQEDEQLQFAAGFDHNFVLRPQGSGVAVEVYEPSTGRRLEVATTEPGVQLYTGQLLDGRTTGAYGRAFARHAGLCLETQHFPDSPNNPQFPSTLLRPGDSYDSRTRWRFTAR
jgi:aldose 1-epimerase